jgi:hypothetical protein
VPVLFKKKKIEMAITLNTEQQSGRRNRQRTKHETRVACRVLSQKHKQSDLICGELINYVTK